MEKEKEQRMRYLRMLARQYPTIQAASSEIINLQAILRLPKGTEHFMSDLHGEYQAFIHILNNASGAVREKVALEQTTIQTYSSGRVPYEKHQKLYGDQLEREGYQYFTGNGE